VLNRSLDSGALGSLADDEQMRVCGAFAAVRARQLAKSPQQRKVVLFAGEPANDQNHFSRRIDSQSGTQFRPRRRRRSGSPAGLYGIVDNIDARRRDPMADQLPPKRLADGHHPRRRPQRPPVQLIV